MDNGPWEGQKQVDCMEVLDSDNCSSVLSKLLNTINTKLAYECGDKRVRLPNTLLISQWKNDNVSCPQQFNSSIALFQLSSMQGFGNMSLCDEVHMEFWYVKYAAGKGLQWIQTASGPNHCQIGCHGCQYT